MKRRLGLLILHTQVVTVPNPRDYEPELELKRRALRTGQGLKHKRIDVIGEEPRRRVEEQPDVLPEPQVFWTHKCGTVYVIK